MGPTIRGLNLTEDVRSDVIDLYWPEESRWSDVDIFTWISRAILYYHEINDCLNAVDKRPRTLFTTPESTQDLAEEWRCKMNM